MSFSHMDAGGLAPGSQRKILRWALIVGGLTVALGMLGLFLDSTFQARWSAGSWLGAATDLLFTSMGLLTLSQPTPVPTHPVFSLGRGTALVFALLAGYTVVSTLLGTVMHAVRLRGIQGRSRPGWLRRGIRWVAASSDSGPAGHTVIVGLGWLGKQLVEDLRSQEPEAHRRRRSGPRDVIAIEIDENNPAILGARRRGAVVIEGDARDPLVRDEALLRDAAEVFVVCGDDAVNLDVTGELISSLKDAGVQAGEGPRLYLHIGEPEFSKDLASRGVFQGEAGQRVSVFNLWENAARRLMIDPDRGLGTRFAPRADEVPHYVVVGFGEMGRTVALEIGRLAHFRSRRRPRLTVMDDFADPSTGATREAFLAQHPGFSPDMRLTDASWLGDPDRDRWSYRHPSVTPISDTSVDYAVHAEFLEMRGRVVTPELVDTLMSRMTMDGVRPAIVVCFDDDRESVRAALHLERLISRLDDPEIPPELPIFVRLHREEGLRVVVSENGEEPRVPLIGFGDVQAAAGYDVIAQPRLEQVAVGMGWAYEVATKEGASYEERVGMVRKLPPDWQKYEGWHESDPPWARLANLGAAAHAAIKLREVGYRLPLKQDPDDPGWQAALFGADDLDIVAEMEHNRWMAQKLIEGYVWEDYPAGYFEMSAEDKAAVRKEMANRLKRAALVPFDELSEEDQEKDKIQTLALPLILKQAKLRPRRLSSARRRSSSEASEIPTGSVKDEGTS